jgi:hypothetical protein
MIDAIGANRKHRTRERLNMAGMTREAVGGGAVELSTGQPAPVAPPERGLTYPITVTKASVEIFPADANRKFLFIENNDALGKVTIAFGGSGATLGVGFNLAPGGGGILLDNNVPTARIFAIGSIDSNPNISAVVA